MAFLSTAAEWLQANLSNVIEFTAILIDIVAFVIVAIAVVKAIGSYFVSKKMNSIALGNTLLFALLVQIGGEIMRIMVAEGYEDVLHVGAILLLRTALALLLHWEVKQEELESQREHSE